MNKEIERRYLKTSELRVVEKDGGLPMLEGYAIVYNTLSQDLGWFREIIKPGAFADSIKTDDIRALKNHDPNLILGRNKAGTLRLFDEEKGLRVEIDLPDVSYARDLAVSIKRGDLNQMSFGFFVDDEGCTWFTDEQGATTRTIVKGTLDDVSAVTYPAYTETSIDVVAKRSFDRSKAKKPALDHTIENAFLRLMLAEKF